MTWILDNARETCSYSGGVFTLGGASSGNSTIRTALADVAPAADTEYCYVTARYIDQGYSNNWERMICSYENSTDTLTRVSTLRGSSGISAVSFDAPGGASDNLYIYGCSPADSWGVRTLQEDVFAGFGTLSTGETSTTFVSGSTLTREVVPVNPNSELIVTWTGRVKSMQPSVSGSSYQSALALFVFDGSAWSQTGIDARFGGIAFPADADMGIADTVTVTVSIPSSSGSKNSSGNWEFKPYLKIIDANTEVDLDVFSAHYREIL